MAKEGFVEGMVDEFAKFPGQVLETVMDGVMHAIFDPFTSSSPSSSPPDQHFHCYPCRDEDCNTR